MVLMKRTTSVTLHSSGLVSKHSFGGGSTFDVYKHTDRVSQTETLRELPVEEERLTAHAEEKGIRPEHFIKKTLAVSILLISSKLFRAQVQNKFRSW